MVALSLTYAYARSGFLIFLGYRLRYLIGVINYIIYVSVAWYLWDAIFFHSKKIASWTLAEMQTYVCINWIARSIYYSNSDNVLASRIIKGEVVSDLMRPNSLLLQLYGTALGEMLFRMLFMGLPIGILVILIYGLTLPVNLVAGVGFLLSIVGAFHLFFAINFLTGLCAIMTEKIQGFLWAKFILLQLLSGALLPLEFFPPTFRAVLEWLPFKGIAYTPMNIYLGRWDEWKMLQELGLQLGWTIALLLLCKLGWRLVRQRLCAHGG